MKFSLWDRRGKLVGNPPACQARWHAALVGDAVAVRLGVTQNISMRLGRLPISCKINFPNCLKGPLFLQILRLRFFMRTPSVQDHHSELKRCWEKQFEKHTGSFWHWGFGASFGTIERVWLKRALPTNPRKPVRPYYQMRRCSWRSDEAATNGESSHGGRKPRVSVQNVMETKARGRDKCSPHRRVSGQAGAGRARPCSRGKGDPKFDEIRALFPIRRLTMIFVSCRLTAVITDFCRNGRQTILLGKGSFGRPTGCEKYLQLFGSGRQGEPAESRVVPMPVPALEETARSTGLCDCRFMAGLPMSVESCGPFRMTLLCCQLGATTRSQSQALELGDPLPEPPGQAADIATTSLPVAAFHHHLQ